MKMVTFGTSLTIPCHLTVLCMLILLGISSGQGSDSVVSRTPDATWSNGSNRSIHAISRSVEAKPLVPPTQLTGGSGTNGAGVRNVGRRIGNRGPDLGDTNNMNAISIFAADACPTNCSCTLSQSRLNINCSLNTSANFEAQLSRLVLAVPLATLTINQSPLSCMSRGGICKLTSLVYMDLSSNKLSDIPAGCFAGMSKLTTLILDVNQIQKLADGVFDGLSSITVLHINNNAISDIGTNVFVNYTMFWNIQSIGLMNNKLSAVDVWPLYLAVHRDYHNHKLRIDLSNNTISGFTNHLGWVYNCSMKSATAKMDFSYNPIAHILPIFHGWSIINEITTMCLFNHDGFRVSLRYCPLICDCKDFIVYKYIKFAKWSQDVNQLMCAKPDSMYHDMVVRVPLEKFVCDLVQDCPHGCQCVQQPSSWTLYIHCQGTLAVTLPRKIPKRPPRYKIKLEFEDNIITQIDSKYYFEYAYYADLSRNQIKNITLEAIDQLRNMSNIYLQQNLISKLPKEIANFNFSRVIQLGLYHNPFSCSCEDRWIKDWLRRLNAEGKLSHPEGISCESPARLKGSNILDLDDDEFCRDPNKEAALKLVTMSVCSVVLTVVLFFLPVVVGYRVRIWIYRKFHWHPFDRDECVGEDKEFDVFVSYANPDENWVIDLVQDLEAEDCRVLFHKRDFLGGLPITDNIGLAVEKSKRVVCVVSENYLNSAMCMWEFTAAINVDLELKKHRTLVIKFEGLSEDAMNPTMRAYMRSHTYIERQSNHFMSNLLYSMPQNRLKPEASASPRASVEWPKELDSDSDSDEYPGNAAKSTHASEEDIPDNERYVSYPPDSPTDRAPLLTI